MDKTDTLLTPEVIAGLRNTVLEGGYASLPETMKLSRVAEQARNFAREVLSAYWDQRGGGVMHYLTAQDVIAADQWAAWAEYDASISQWLADKDNEAAEQLDARGMLPEEMETRIAQRPKPPSYDRPHKMPPDFPPVMPTMRNLKPWADYLDHLLNHRRASVLARRGP